MPVRKGKPAEALEEEWHQGQAQRALGPGGTQVETCSPETNQAEGSFTIPLDGSRGGHFNLFHF